MGLSDRTEQPIHARQDPLWNQSSKSSSPKLQRVDRSLVVHAPVSWPSRHAYRYRFHFGRNRECFAVVTGGSIGPFPVGPRVAWNRRNRLCISMNHQKVELHSRDTPHSPSRRLSFLLFIRRVAFDRGNDICDRSEARHLSHGVALAPRGRLVCPSFCPLPNDRESGPSTQQSGHTLPNEG